MYVANCDLKLLDCKITRWKYSGMNDERKGEVKVKYMHFHPYILLETKGFWTVSEWKIVETGVCETK